jgi:hypothetical protein
MACARSSTPSLDEAQLLHWPALIMYPEYMQQDEIQDLCEEETLAAHLDVVRGLRGKTYLLYRRVQEYCDEGTMAAHMEVAREGAVWAGVHVHREIQALCEEETVAAHLGMGR